MVFDEAGTYQIEYTATDECGNTTNAERTVIVEAPPTYRTVLYTDGTFIINESSRDEAANVAEHGQPTNVYIPFDPNGATDVDKYIFSYFDSVLWYNQKSSISSIEIGSEIAPTSCRFWFSECSNCTSINVSHLDTRNLKSMKEMFYGCSSLTTLDLSNFDTSNVRIMQGVFRSCSLLTSVDLSSFNTSNAENMENMFASCNALTSLDLSGFNTSNVEVMSSMFKNSKNIVTIYVSSDFNVTQVTSSSDMFYNCTHLVGGAGTVWSSSYIDKTRAKIDGGVGDEGYFTAKN